MMALIEWDPADRAEEYELAFTYNSCDILDCGTDIFKYEDILDTPRTYTYKVHGTNDFGVGEWNEELVIGVE
ncbi:hypothetical protein DRQ33_06330 [bacterium]|nr:MAG: hypothetical protein DRQ33_06330 [bacterium]